MYEYPPGAIQPAVSRGTDDATLTEVTRGTGNVQLGSMFAHASYIQVCISVYMCHLNGRAAAQLLRTHAVKTRQKTTSQV